MKCRKHNFNLDDVQFIYRYTVLELVRRGYAPSQAKQMVKARPLLDRVRACAWVYSHDMDEKDWANIVEKYRNQTRQIHFELKPVLFGVESPAYKIRA